MRTTLAFLLAFLAWSAAAVAQGVPQDSQDWFWNPFYTAFSGAVVLEDWKPPPESLSVGLICDNQVVMQAYTDRKGSFSLETHGGEGQYGFRPRGLPIHGARFSGSGAMNDAFIGTVPGRPYSGPCELRVQETPGFEAEPLLLRIDGPIDDDVGVIVLRRDARAEPALFSWTTLYASPEARNAHDRAMEELSEPDVNQSRVAKHLEKAVQLYPGFALAWNQLAQTRLALSDPQGARIAFHQALDADSDYFGPYLGLAGMALDRREWLEAGEYTQRLVELNPEHASARYFDGVVHFRLDRFPRAKQHFLSIVEDEQIQQFPKTHFYLGMIYSKEGDIRAAAAEFHSFLRDTPPEAVPEEMRKSIVEQLQSWEEQGLIERTEDHT